ncbi:hypothetical protein GH714_015647 [Hevea brasiliensis]|uniref:Phytosulfokine n=1 Tax=Hevea brasiliensis TaxID=3981 RepID=A0A6A6LKE5_HEVBR|nr:hypothetical protein GH714_015450 [Hevea brasiliensis]KAF2300768.1 hypothetical protein GH714_015647 [Hevea brasiliensis]
MKFASFAEQEQVNFNAMTSQDSIVEVDSSSELLMGSEVCETGDEECFKRRLVSEAHLDYIYTQHHKP